MAKVFIKQTKDFYPQVDDLLDTAGLRKVIADQKKIVIKPNLTCLESPPSTTPPDIVKEIIKYIQKNNPQAKIIVAEGSGGTPTDVCFEKLGYKNLQKELGIELLNINIAETIIIKNKKFTKFKKIYFPKEILDAFLISVPVLKEHGESIVTLSLKNSLGLFPSSHHGRPGGEKSGDKGPGIHQWPIDFSIADINLCKKADFVILDGRKALLDWGKPTQRVKNFYLILASFDPVAIDKVGAEILGYQNVPHINLCAELNIGTKAVEKVFI